WRERASSGMKLVSRSRRANGSKRSRAGSRSNRRCGARGGELTANGCWKPQRWVRREPPITKTGSASTVSSFFLGISPARRCVVERLHVLPRTCTGESYGVEVLRKNEPMLFNASRDPTRSLLLPRMLYNAFDWFNTESFKDLHPVERAAVVYLRLLDLQPFPSHTETTATLAASFYTEREGLPPLVIFADDTTLARYSRALEAAFRMLTQPLVEIFAEMLTRTMRIGQGVER